jgi:hypothetical protein
MRPILPLPGSHQYAGALRSLTIVPRHPLLRAGSHFLKVFLEFGEIVERIGRPANSAVSMRLMKRSPT